MLDHQEPGSMHHQRQRVSEAGLGIGCVRIDSAYQTSLPGNPRPAPEHDRSPGRGSVARAPEDAGAAFIG